MALLKYYAVVEDQRQIARRLVGEILKLGVEFVSTENCYYIETSKNLGEQELKTLEWILLKPFCGIKLVDNSCLECSDPGTFIIEVGPRLSYCTPFSTNAVSIFHHAGLKMVNRVEKSTRYLLKSLTSLGTDLKNDILDVLHDPMTQVCYANPLKSFDIHQKRLSWSEIDILNGGESALLKANAELGLAMDEQDVKLYLDLFRNKLKRNPTSVECFDLAQSNSEHSRHWFFNGVMHIDGMIQQKSMFQLVKETRKCSNYNNVIAFCDNSSAIKGFEVDSLVPKIPGKPGPVHLVKSTRHITLTAETHNFPTGVAPFPGATTGTGGRQRDQHAAGRGAYIIAGTAGYCVGNLNLPHHPLSWEDQGQWELPSNLADAAKIAIEASDGASDYGNKFGEPVITGFFRSCGILLPDGKRVEWLKPIMFSGGIGSIEDQHTCKIDLKSATTVDDIVVGKIGGPAYSIGVGGGAASSLVQGDNTKDRDFNAVQRGDAQMQQKLDRVIRTCIEMKNDNPILSIHDQGAGGNGNVLKEIVEPAGAIIHTDAFTKGDSSLTTLELWVAEYQESDAILLYKDRVKDVEEICQRERSALDVVGQLTGDGKLVLCDQGFSGGKQYGKRLKTGDAPYVHRPPVELELEHVLGKMPAKKYYFETEICSHKPFKIPDITVKNMILEVLKLPSVGSKRFLTTKVDRSVNGLIAQQQCVGPLHTPLADVAVTALSHFSCQGSATAIGEQPIKMLVEPASGARMAVGEALTNLVFAVVSDIRDIKCSGNWMWPAKLAGEGPKIYYACQAMCKVMESLGIAIDGGKDSLSMAARVGSNTVKCPGSLVISAYAPCPDVTAKVTPDLKCSQTGASLIYVPMSRSKGSLGGSALAQCFGQIGDSVPDLDDARLFVDAWKTTQKLISAKKVMAGHDVSDGGLVVCLLEMAFAGNRGIRVDINSEESELAILFSERLGLVLETEFPAYVVQEYQKNLVKAVEIGKSVPEREVTVLVNGGEILRAETTGALRDVWESTSFALEILQCNNDCVEEERNWIRQCMNEPPFNVSFDPNEKLVLKDFCSDIKVAILREEGSNGDCEMRAAFMKAGFETWDVTMQDLLDDSITLDRFRGVAFVGGFSFADVFGAAKGWAACSLFNHRVRKQFDAFYHRSDTFSFGVCNGFQLMALLGWVGVSEEGAEVKTHELGAANMSCYIDHNKSGRFESRFVTVKVMKTTSIMLQNMEGSQLGVWVAHGEGRIRYRDSSVLTKLSERNMAPLRYINNEGEPTVQYPFNPNGSELGVAGICSSDGRHLAMMPHPERCVEIWNYPWMPKEWHDNIRNSPWKRIFDNAMQWCMKDTL